VLPFFDAKNSIEYTLGEVEAFKNKRREDMFEKVNPSHPDKVADRIAGALVDYAYTQQDMPKVAIEILVGHGKCHIIAETSVVFPEDVVKGIVERIAGEGLEVIFDQVPQDEHLAENQSEEIRCGDNGIFKGVPITEEQKKLTDIAKDIYRKLPKDGKYILNGDRLIICQSNADTNELKELYPDAEINPLGDWTGGPDVDSGATNRKLGSDMADSVTGGGLMGKDLSKADVSVNIFCFLMAQKTGKPYTACCAIGDTEVNGIPYSEIVRIARKYIDAIGGFERFAEWGLVR